MPSTQLRHLMDHPVLMYGLFATIDVPSNSVDKGRLGSSSQALRIQLGILPGMQSAVRPTHQSICAAVKHQGCALRYQDKLPWRWLLWLLWSQTGEFINCNPSASLHFPF